MVVVTVPVMHAVMVMRREEAEEGEERRANGGDVDLEARWVQRRQQQTIESVVRRRRMSARCGEEEAAEEEVWCRGREAGEREWGREEAAVVAAVVEACKDDGRRRLTCTLSAFGSFTSPCGRGRAIHWTTHAQALTAFRGR